MKKLLRVDVFEYEVFRLLCVSARTAYLVFTSHTCLWLLRWAVQFRGAKPGTGGPSKVNVQSVLLLPGQDQTRLALASAPGRDEAGHCLRAVSWSWPCEAELFLLNKKSSLHDPRTNRDDVIRMLCAFSAPDHCPRPLSGAVSEIYDAARSRRPSVFPQSWNEVTKVCLSPSERLTYGTRARPTCHLRLF